MSMPQDLVLIRHGQSEANVRQRASKRGDNRLFTDDLVTVPDNSWRLTTLGASQAQLAGTHLEALFPQGFDRYIVSPFMRTRETAANLRLPDAAWEENRIIRERSWGEIDGLSIAEFEENYPQNALYKEKDPIYWAPPAGESMAAVIENRSSNFLRGLSRDSSGARVLAVTHGEFITATRMLIEQWSDEQFFEVEADPEQKVRNCLMVHYTRRDPETGKLAPNFQWVKLAYPDISSGQIMEGRWAEFSGAKPLGNGELLALVESQERRLAEADAIREASETGAIDIPVSH